MFKRALTVFVCLLLGVAVLCGCNQEVKTPTDLTGKVYKFKTIYFEPYEWLDKSEVNEVKERLTDWYGINVANKDLETCLNLLAQKQTQEFAESKMELHFQDDDNVQIVLYYTNSKGEEKRDRQEGVYELDGDKVILTNHPGYSDEFYYECKLQGKYLDFYTNYEDSSYGHSWWSMGEYVQKHTMFILR